MSSLSSLVALLALILACTALSIGLTFAPCYSSVCSEDFFPFETRLHVASYYATLLITGLAFLLRAKSRSIKSFSQRQVCKRRLPLLEAKITYGGVVITTWLLFAILVTTAIWLEIKPWWNARLASIPGWRNLSTTTTVTCIIGHHIDLALGLVIIPVPRHSTLCEAFGFPSSTLLWAHKALAYLLLIGTIAHGAAYIDFIATYMNSAVQTVSILNPYITSTSSERQGVYALANFPTGIISLAFLIIIAITALNYFRRRHYELFYYTHIVMGILFMIAACIHASTNFYCLLPGLALWAYDWAWRLFGGVALVKSHEATIEKAENGWIRVSMLPSEGTKTIRPLQTYYLNVPRANKLQCHPMSATTSRVGETQFLFAECDGKQWTRSVGELENNQTKIHLEGPYFPSIPDLTKMSHMICIVGGTGITGALSIADWWKNTNTKLTIIWTVRDAETTQLAEWQNLLAIEAARPSLQLIVHVTSKSGRLDIRSTISEHVTSEKASTNWVYISGPEGLIRDGEDACIDIQKELRRDGSSHVLEYHAPSWES